MIGTATLNERYSRWTNAEPFANPFFDAASLMMPEQFTSALQLCEHVYYACHPYRSAMEKIVAFFVGAFDVAGEETEIGHDERTKWTKYYLDTLNGLQLLARCAHDFMAYGNFFLVSVVPFQRMMNCPCGFAVTAEEMTDNPTFRARWDAGAFTYRGHCPRCGKDDKWTMQDLPGDVEQELSFRLIPPVQMKIEHDLRTGKNKYHWILPPEYRRAIIEGNAHVIAGATKNILECVRRNVPLTFNREAIFHGWQSGLSGLKLGGWGLPQIMWLFRGIFNYQVVQRFNEAIMLDYIVPIRVVTPPAESASSTAGGGDALRGLFQHNLGDFRSRVLAMFRHHRRDPSGVYVFPFPLQYQILGGEAANLAPHEMLQFTEKSLIDAAGFPYELYQSNMALPQTAAALKFLASCWRNLSTELNRCLRWMSGRTADLLSWERANVQLQEPAIIHDVQMQAFIMALLQSGRPISNETLYSFAGLRYRDQARAAADETLFDMKQQKKLKDEAESASLYEQLIQMGSPTTQGMPPGAPGGPPAAAGAPPGGPGGGAPPAGPGGAPGAQGGLMGGMGGAGLLGPGADPQDIVAAAQDIAQQLISAPESDKRMQLKQLKSENESLYLQTKSELEKMREDIRRQGGNQAMQQTTGKA